MNERISPKRPSRAFRGVSIAMGPVLVVLLAGCPTPTPPGAPPPPQVLVTEVVAEDVPVRREWLGETLGRADVEIRARVPGFLEGIHFQEGSRVSKGDPLYTIDKSELLEQKTGAEAKLAAQRTELAYAESDVERYRPLAEMNAVSRRDLDSAVARRDAAVAQVEAAEAEVRLADIRLSYADIHAPMDGLIGFSLAKVGDFVGQSPNPVVLNTISDVDPIHVRFPVGEQEYLEFARRFPEREARAEENRVGLDLILADGSLFPEKGKVFSVERNINASTGTLTIEAEFPNPSGILRPGQYAMVRTVVEVLPDALIIPQRAVQELQGRFQVWVVSDAGTVELRTVVPGQRLDRRWVIREGLKVGESIVVEGVQRLRAGLTVRPEPWTAPELPDSNETGS